MHPEAALLLRPLISPSQLTASWFGVPWSDALGAIGTAGALLIAVVGVFYEVVRTGKARDEENARSARDLREREVAQASHVAAWLRVRAYYAKPEYYLDIYDSDEQLCVQNTSAKPVFEVVVEQVWKHSETRYGYRRAVLMPNQDPEILLTNREAGIQDDATHLKRVTFRDAAGLWWSREISGELEKLGGPPDYAGWRIVE